MNILFVTFYFPPEVGAPQRRIWEFAVKLKEGGHRVKILTGFPNYPQGKLIPPYQRRLYLRENMDGVEVLRVFHFLANRREKWGRALVEGSFSISASVAALLEAAPDVVIVESPSLLSCGAGVFLRHMRGTPFVMHVSDLIPDGAVAVGMLSPGGLFALLKRLATFFYREADAIVTVTEGFKKAILEQGIPSRKICLIPNGVGDVHVRPEMRRLTDGKFQVVYAGNFGRAYNWNTVIEAARRLPDEEFEFELIGDGIDRSELEREACSLPHVRFMRGMPVEKMFERLYKADAMVIPLTGSPVLEAIIPSKMADAMAASLPVILAARKGELVDIVRNNRAGVVIEPDSAGALVEALVFLQENRAEALKMGQRGCEFVKKTRLRSRLTEQLEKMLLEVIDQKRKEA